MKNEKLVDNSTNILIIIILLLSNIHCSLSISLL